MSELADRACRFCQAIGPHTVTPRTSGVHTADVRCRKCERHLGFPKKPDNERTKHRREPQHRDLVAKYGSGVCEMCLRGEEELPKGQTLEAQHVKEYHDGGDASRENIWIVCTACHRLIHWVRNYRSNTVTIRNQATETELAPWEL